MVKCENYFLSRVQTQRMILSLRKPKRQSSRNDCAQVGSLCQGLVPSCNLPTQAEVPSLHHIYRYDHNTLSWRAIIPLVFLIRLILRISNKQIKRFSGFVHDQSNLFMLRLLAHLIA